MPTQTYIIKKSKRIPNLAAARKVAIEKGAKKTDDVDFFKESGTWHFRQLPPSKFKKIRGKILNKDVTIMTGKLKNNPIKKRGTKMPRKKTKKRLTDKKKSIRKKRRATKKRSQNNPNPKKRKKGVKKVAKKRKRTYKRRRRRRSNPGNPGNPRLKMQDILMQAGLGAAGAIGGSMVASKIPLPDPRMKAALPLAMAVGLSFTPFAKGKQIQAMIIGLATVGSLSLIRQFMPNIPLLAGEDEIYLPEDETELLGYNDLDEEDLDELIEGEGDLEDVESDIEAMGVTADLDGDALDLEGDSLDILGEGEDIWITPSD